MTIHFTFDANDNSEWGIHYARTNQENNRRLLRIRILMPLSTLCLALSLRLLGYYGPSLAIVGFGAGVTALTFIMPLFMPSLIRYRMRKRFEKPENAKDLGQRSLSINEQGLTCITDSATTIFQWKAIDTIDVTPGYAFVRIGTKAAIVIPRATVEDGLFNNFVEEALKLRSQSANQTAFPQRAI